MFLRKKDYDVVEKCHNVNQKCHVITFYDCQNSIKAQHRSAGWVQVWLIALPLIKVILDHKHPNATLCGQINIKKKQKKLLATCTDDYVCNHRHKYPYNC